MDTVKAIVAHHGYDNIDDMDVGDYIKVNREHMMPLSIEKISDDRLSVAHHYTQRGDLMCDPEIVFRLDNEQWVPVRFRQDPRVYQHDEDGLTDVRVFAKQWDTRLETQGYLDAAQTQEVDA